MRERPTQLAAGERPPAPELSARVRAALEAGRVCALPTETVYGLAARADRPAALDELRRIKGRPAALTFTWHVGTRERVAAFGELGALVRRLTERYWPGPLTLVLRGVPAGLEAIAQDGWTGVRCPAHATTAALLAACEFPLVMTSANRHGGKPLTRAEDVESEFGNELALVVDGGPARLGEASGVLRLGRGHFELLREGLLSLEELRRTAGLRIAFVCTGNTCRSPMAEALAKKLLVERLGLASAADLSDFGFEVLSMGVHAASGAPASGGTREALAARGIDLGPHRSRPATPEALARLDRIYGLTAGHVEALRATLPPGRAAAIERLDPTRDIADPIGGGPEVYARALEEIERGLRARLDDWA
jgi:protein-tyrosine phosphatase